jgi:FMN-dependent NADH-azoreductase
LDYSIVVPGKTFRYGPRRPEEELVGNKRVIVAITRGVFYTSRTADISAEHAEAYMRSVLSFLGVNNPEFIVAESVTTGEENRARALAFALGAVQQLVA